MPTAYGASQYKQADVMNASPIRLVVMAYDLAITSCEREDFETAVKAIIALRDALDYDYPEVAGGLLALYNYLLDQLRARDFVQVKNLLSELREAWATVEKRMNTSSIEIAQVQTSAQASA
ncbi:MAG: flagellar protein FliS [Anaerolineae bacterium]|nr:flagellar protein FliS [Anaerolineae bacterium]